MADDGVADTEEVGPAEGAAGVDEPGAGDAGAGTDTRVRAVADAPASPTPAQPVTPTRAAITTADLRFHKEVIGAGYPWPRRAGAVAHAPVDSGIPVDKDPGGWRESPW
ncbi:hypothetical protein GCM10027612_10660 [Microbispora bryophytorum subsp. camponoti]